MLRAQAGRRGRILCTMSKERPNMNRASAPRRQQAVEPARSKGAGGAEDGRADGERLQKYLAHAGVASRRHAEALIASGAVTVNGAEVRELGTRVDLAKDEVRVHGKLVRPAARPIYVLLNKPAGTVTTASDPEGRRTVLDLLPEAWRAERVYPVGRLDWDTEGLLLLTNDGELALRLTHPRYALTKQYHAVVEGRPSRETLERLAHGMALPGEPRPTAPARAWIVEERDDTAEVGIEIHEGRNRQVRRMLEAVGHPAVRLRRVRVGPLTLGTLARGRARLLTEREVAALKQAVGLDADRPAR
jgi:23S rRNA pseudouridine2605 synthase